MIKIEDGIIGFIIGDALGVPYEFKEREEMKKNPAKDMIGYGTYNQPPGTWSDDTSLTLCLMDSLLFGYNINDISIKFIEWCFKAKYTPYGKVFDIGNTTRESIVKLMNGINPVSSGGNQEYDNGNGSLMRVLPLIYYLKDFDNNNKFRIIKEVSSITHAHPRSIIACSIYIELGIQLLKKHDIIEAINNMKIEIKKYFSKDKEICNFETILNTDISFLNEKEIKSDGYVVNTLLASIWCLLKSNNYKESVLKAVNLGFDTDTTAAVTGGLAGIYFGYESIPKEWINKIIKKDKILNICNLFDRKYL